MRARHRLSKFCCAAGCRYQEAQAWRSQAHAVAADTEPSMTRARRRRSLTTSLAWSCSPAAAQTCSRRSSSRPRVLARPGNRPAAVLPRDRHALGRWGVRRGRHLYAFPSAALISGFLGIVPSERTSDLKRRQGSITKAGPPHARRLLVEAAHHYRRQPAIGETSPAAKQAKTHGSSRSPGARSAVFTSAGSDLHAERRKPAGVVAIAVARELAAFLWEAATLD